MVRRINCSAVGVWLFASVLACLVEAKEPEPLAIGSQIGNFTLADFRSKKWSLDELRAKPVVVVAWLGVECPLVRQYASRLQELATQYEAQGVAVLGVFSNQQDSLQEIGHFARQLEIDFPLLKDPGNFVADKFHASRTPQVFVLDAERKLRYRGRIDDQFTYGVQKPAVQKEYLVDAIDSVLAGKQVTTPETDPVGCHIGRVLKAKSTSDVTYSKQISRLLNRRCVECHRPGEIGPFSLTGYDETVGWAEMIREVVDEQRMPPWHADPRHGEFVNDARLTDEEKDQIRRWVDAGAPEGNPKDLPPPPTFVEGWRIGKPDLILPMADQPFKVPAKGEIQYQYFIVDPGFKEDKWIAAAECRPDNRSVVHHIVVSVHPRTEVKQMKDSPSDFLVATAAGARPMILPEGYAKLVPAGSRLVFQVHYTPVGTPQEDRSSVGLVFADRKSVRRQVGTRQAANHAFRIPAGADNYRVEAAYRFSSDMVLMSLYPHMHLRGKAFRYTATYPSGEQEILLSVPKYDTNWQNSYELVKHKPMPEGTTIQCLAIFDNSENNPANPAPHREVAWGDQAYDEMMIGYFDVAPAKDGVQGGMSRSALFSEAMGGKAPPLDEELKIVARDSLKSEANFRRLAPRLRELVPQVDRVCWTTVEGGKFNVRRCVQSAERDRVVGGAGRIANAKLCAVAGYATASEPVVHQQLAQQSAGDLKAMSRAFNASLHIPVKVDGVPGTINFWSGEKDAFPPEAVKILTEAAKVMAAD